MKTFDEAITEIVKIGTLEDADAASVKLRECGERFKALAIEARQNPTLRMLLNAHYLTIMTSWQKDGILIPETLFEVFTQGVIVGITIERHD